MATRHAIFLLAAVAADYAEDCPEPLGSYEDSCNGCRVNEECMLSCTCMGVTGNTEAGQPVRSECDLLADDCVYIRNIAGTLHCEDSSGSLKACVATSAPTPAPTYTPSPASTAPPPVIIYQQIPSGSSCGGRLEVSATARDDRTQYNIEECRSQRQSQMSTCLTKAMEDGQQQYEGQIVVTASGVQAGGCAFGVSVDFSTLEAANSAGVYVNGSAFQADVTRCLCTENNSSDTTCHTSAHTQLPMHLDLSHVHVLADSCSGTTSIASAKADNEDGNNSNEWTALTIALACFSSLLIMVLLLGLVIWSRRQEKSSTPAPIEAGPVQPTVVSHVDSPTPPAVPEFDEDEHEPEDFDDIL